MNGWIDSHGGAYLWMDERVYIHMDIIINTIFTDSDHALYFNA